MSGSSQILDEYLVRLGFQTDTVSFAKFSSVLRDASSLVDNEVFRMGKSLVEFQVGVTGMFVSLAAGVVGFAEKAAMADQDYRLLALHMYTSLPVARSLKVALDALGQPLENVLWDPELAGRFHQLVEDQKKMTEGLGPDFEQQMLKIRDIIFQFQRLGAIIQNYLIPLVVKDLAKAFGTDLDGVFSYLKEKNDYLVKHLPEISDWIAEKLKPILVETKDVLLETFDLIKQIVLEFKDFDVVAFIEKTGKAVIALVELERNLVLLLSAGGKALTGDFTGAIADMKLMHPVGDETPPPVTDLTGAGPVTSTASIKKTIVSEAIQYGVPPQLALALAGYESQFKQFRPDGSVIVNRGKHGESHATGIFQLQPHTAASYGGKDPKDMGGNIYDAMMYIKYLMDQNGNDQEKVIRAYHGGAEKDRQAEAKAVMAAEPGYLIDGITVTVNAQTNASPSDIGKVVVDSIYSKMASSTQRTLGEFANRGGYTAP